MKVVPWDKKTIPDVRELDVIGLPNIDVLVRSSDWEYTAWMAMDGERCIGLGGIYRPMITSGIAFLYLSDDITLKGVSFTLHCIRKFAVAVERMELNTVIAYVDTSKPVHRQWAERLGLQRTWEKHSAFGRTYEVYSWLLYSYPWQQGQAQPQPQAV